jgi:repressor LexA
MKTLAAKKTDARTEAKTPKMKSPLPLTSKEKSVLEFIEISLSENGVCPSYQEIKDHFGFASYNSVQNYLKQLVTKGYILIPTHQKRAIQILQPSTTVQDQVQKSTPSRSPLLREGGEVFSLPLLGKVAAGLPIEAFEHNEFLEVPASMVRNPDKTFALKVSGASMIEDGILDGDLILVQKQATAQNGEIVVASVEEESTVKRFYLHSQPERRIELRPANSTMKSIWYPPDQVKIQGILVSLLRKF